MFIGLCYLDPTSFPQLKAFLLQQTFYSVDEYLSHVQAPWKGILGKVWYLESNY